MAQKRMIDKKISVSEQVDNLSVEAKLIFTWAIPHADDLGLLPCSYKTFKALVVPMWDMRLETFGNHMEDIVNQGLFKIFEYNGEKFFRLVNFTKHQTLKKDRQPNTYLNFQCEKDPKESWKKISKETGFQMEDNGFQMDTEEKRREEKRSNTYASDFLKFWEIYPKKKEKPKAHKAWKKIKPDEKLQVEIKVGIEKYKKSEEWKEIKYIPYPERFLKNEKWNDEIIIKENPIKKLWKSAK